MYGLWIQKPLNVQDPTLVDLRDDSDVLAFMIQHEANGEGTRFSYSGNSMYGLLDHLSSRLPRGRYAGFKFETESGIREVKNVEIVYFNAGSLQLLTNDTGIRPDISSLTAIARAEDNWSNYYVLERNA
jgi:hypothetical protein